MPETITRDQLLDLADDNTTAALWQLVDKSVARGSGIAVYTNHELGHPYLGHIQFVSFGHPDAQLEDAEPPERLPDIGDAINWRYVLTHVWRATWPA